EVLDVMPGVGEQHLFDEVGMAGEEDSPRAEAEAGQVAVLPGDVEEEVEPAGHEVAQAAAEQGAFWAGRQAGVRDRAREVHGGIVGAIKAHPLLWVGLFRYFFTF